MMMLSAAPAGNLPCDPMDPYCDDPLASSLVGSSYVFGATPPFAPDESSGTDAGSVDYVELEPTVIHGTPAPGLPSWVWIAAGLAGLWAFAGAR